MKVIETFEIFKNQALKYSLLYQYNYFKTNHSKLWDAGYQFVIDTIDNLSDKHFIEIEMIIRREFEKRNEIRTWIKEVKNLDVLRVIIYEKDEYYSGMGMAYQLIGDCRTLWWFNHKFTELVY